MNPFLWLPRLAWLPVVLFAASVALAHSGASGIVKERMDHMKSIAASTKVIGSMLKGAIAFDEGAFREAAIEISNHGGGAMTSLFPQGSIEGPSESLPAIWQEWNRFEAMADRLATTAKALAETATNDWDAEFLAISDPSPEDIKGMSPKQAFGQVANTCRDCHEAFRLEK